MNSNIKTYLLQGGLFLATFITTTLTGADWIHGEWTDFWTHFITGLPYSIAFLGILTVHEFGHYFAAKKHGVESTLPYFIPFYFGPLMNLAGTMGAFIKMKSQASTTKQIFDIGVAGPLAGFVLTLVVLFVGFIQLDGKTYIYSIHPEYKKLGENFENQAYTYDFYVSQVKESYEKYVSNAKKSNEQIKPLVVQDSYTMLAVGDNLLMHIMKTYVFVGKDWIPNNYELYHYPLLFAAYLAMFFTALNLMPIGQLDGGHILYGLIGSKNFNIISPIFFFIFLFFAGLGIIHPKMETEEFLSSFAMYGFYLFLTLQRVFNNDTNKTIIAALSLILSQILTSYLFPSLQGYMPWLLFGFILGRVLGVYHPPSLVEERLNLGRQIIGWLALVVFILCFTPQVLVYVELTKP